jgi:predicted DCC family thiol-disulfide oxidoreductase YuxK
VLDSISLPSYRSVDAELRKAGLLRFALGIVIFVRFFQIFSSYYVYASSDPIPLWERLGMGAYLVLTVSFTVGFLTQISTIAVAWGAVLVDGHFATRTLGTDVLTGVMFVLFLINSGQRYSIDRLILVRGGVLQRVLGPMQWFGGAHEMHHIKTAYVLGFVFYALLSFVALSFHLVDPFWLSGLTTKSLLTNSYLCKHYQLFRSFEGYAPVALSLFSIFSAIGQSAFQLFMIPLMFWRSGRHFVCFWGFSFFLISLVLINLSYLPHIELVLWMLIFVPFGSTAPTVEIVYDDRCNLCRGTMRTLSFIDLSGGVRFLPASRSMEILKSWNVSEDEIATHMVGVVRGELHRGYDLYVSLAKEKILLWPLLPVLLFGSWSGLGERVYEKVSARRRAFFGACELEATQSSPFIELPTYPVVAGVVRRFCYWSLGMSCVLFLLIEAPGLRTLTARVVPEPLIAMTRRWLEDLGFEPPYVFNEADLSMGDRWLEIYSQSVTGQWEIVSLRGKEGERLNYEGWDILNFTNHNSDFLYFGETLRLSRLMISGVDEPTAFFSERGAGFRSIEKRVKFDYRKHHRTGEAVYLVRLQSNRSSRVTHWQADLARFEPQLRYEAIFCYGGNGRVFQLTGADPNSSATSLKAECSARLKAF